MYGASKVECGFRLQFGLIRATDPCLNPLTSIQASLSIPPSPAAINETTMTTPPRPKGARPMPISNGSLLNVAPPTSSAFNTNPNPNSDVVDSPESVASPYGSLRPRLNLNLGGPPQPRSSDSSSSSGMSLRPSLSLVYGQSGSSGQVPTKPSLKLGLKLGGAPTPSLNLNIPAGGSGAGSGAGSPIESYYGVIPSQQPVVSLPDTSSSNSLSTPMTEPFSAETLRPPIATIVPSAGHQVIKENSLDELQKAIEAIQIKEADPDADENSQWNNSMFENIRRLGEGAGGAVWQVKQRSTGKMMAMKVRTYVSSAMDEC